ncbi:MAG: hypothetical protein Tsb0034_20720 [Ekhidna sp.]
MRKLFVLLVFTICIVAGCSEDYEVPNHTPGVVKILDGFLMVAYGEGGLIIANENSGEVVTQFFPPREMNSIDDFDVDGELLFLLDSRGRDFVTVCSFRDGNVEILDPPAQVEGGPFNGISAKNGNLVVAGGTSFLNRFRYSIDGKLSGPVNFGRDRGHPDVLLSSDGQAAFVSSDFGIGLDIDRFGVSSLHIGNALEIPFIQSELGIPEAGFTPGVTSPVGFPIQSAIMDNYLLVTHGGGLTIIRLIDNYIFGTATTLDIGISGTAIAVDESIAYITGFQGTDPVLATIDLSDMNSPHISTQILITDGHVPTSVAAGSDDIYIAAGQAGLIKLPKN